MDALSLVSPSRIHIAAIDNYRDELLSAEDAMEGCGTLKNHSATEWLQFTQALSTEKTCPENLVVTTHFLCLRESDQKLVGMIQIRHYFNEYYEKYAGHIGFSVRPSERKKGYASWMLKHCLPYCKKIGLERVLVCCEVSNEGSRKTILSAGGVFEREDYSPDEDIYLERYWIEIL